MKLKRKLKIILGTALVIFLLHSFISYHVTQILTPEDIPSQDYEASPLTGLAFGFTPSKGGACSFDGEVFNLQTSDGFDIAGYHVDEGNQKAILLLHGYRFNHCSLENETEFFIELGYDVFLVDFRAFGSSSGEFTSLGYYEKHDVIAARDYIYRQGYDNIGVYGLSMGAAAAMYAEGELSLFDYLILESPYKDLDSALRNRFNIAGIPTGPMLPVLEYYFENQAGFETEDAKPIEELKKIQKPVLLIAAEKDERVLLSEMEEMHEAANEAELIIVPEVAHGEAFKGAEESIETFLAEI